jgi:AsmA protein
VRVLKLTGIAFGAVIALIIVALLAVRLFVNPNDYRGRIEKAVKDSTGRELDLRGELKLSVFPWIALELGPATLGNPPGFGAQPFIAVQHVALSVKVLPLLHKELQIGRIEIDGLDLRLMKNAEGKGNWEGLGSSGAAASKPAAASPTALPELAGLTFKDGRFSYQDLVADHLNLDVGAIGAGHPVPLKLSLNLTTAPGAQPIAVAGQFDLTPKTDKQEYGLNFSAQLGSAHLTGTALASHVPDAPNLTGTFKLDPVGPRELMAQLGIKPPQTHDPKALSKLAAIGEFAYSGNAVSASKLDVQLDDSELRGSLALTDLTTDAMTFDLAVTQIDLDRYRGPDATAGVAAKPAAAKAPPTPLPTEALKALKLHGTATLGSARFAGIALSQARVTIAAQDGVLHVAPIQAGLYGGTYAGDVALDVRNHPAALHTEDTLNGVDMAQLLKDFAKTQRFSGRGMVTASISAQGDTSDAMMGSLGGHVAANLANGAVEGVDLWFVVSQAMALAQKQPLAGASDSGRTKFDTFKVSADLNKGVATTKDLSIVSQNLHVAGQGTANLVTEAVDYQVKATVLKGTGAAGAGTLAEVPLTVTGTMTAPKVRPDIEGMVKGRVQQELQQKGQDLLKGLFH